MPDTPEIPDTAPLPSPPAAPGTSTEAAPDAPAAAGAPAPRSEPSVADPARLLGQHFPALFGAGVIKPIKLRIQVDIHERAPGVFAKKSLSLFLQRHTTGTAYLRALVAEGAKRFDLDGHPVGEIAAEHRDAAGVELARRRAIVEAKKNAGREAARAARYDARPPRPPGPPLPPQPAEASPSASQAAAERPASGASHRPERSRRPSRPDHETQRRARPPRPQPERQPARVHEQAPATAPSLPMTPEQAAEAEARRQRALLLRSFEQSPLSKANFGALKGLNEAALDALLTQARQERGSR